jgi:hypothetical protein
LSFVTSVSSVVNKMTDVRPIAEADLEAFVAIVARAYPGMRLETPEARAGLLQRLLESHTADPVTMVYGAYRDGALQGGSVTKSRSRSAGWA